MKPCERWIATHPLFVRLYVPVVVTLVLIAQTWETLR